jgi:hypothetical protein
LMFLPLFGKAASESIRGKLVQPAGSRPALEMPDHRTVYLEGDDDTTAVLHDKRLAGMDLEAIGSFKAPDVFVVDPIYKRALFVHKDGKRLMITYFCKVCNIRTYRPGKCRCCQQETDLDLIESDQP